ncbi:MAG TPA: histidine kinase dimerization/phospho-acceptor domain-containing protein, partial [Spirochaetota bacterium]|nr:histidine kinase dimerization/phospho-acceptor domain-containing protein [Spirochaetota bacterium]
MDRADRVTYVNKAGLEVLQKGRLEVVGYPRSNFFPDPVNSNQKKKLDEVFSTKKAIIADEKMKINDGFIYQNTHLIPIFDDDDEVEAVMGITRDVTHLREAEEKLIQAGKIKDEFIANISHEIRNPISVIGGFSEVMERTALSAEQKSYVGMIKSSSDYLLALVNDILDYSKVESGKLKTVENVFSLSNLVDSVKKSFYFQVIKKGIEFTSSIDCDVPENVIGDSLRIMQVLNNLVSNAIKFTD